MYKSLSYPPGWSDISCAVSEADTMPCLALCQYGEVQQPIPSTTTGFKSSTKRDIFPSTIYCVSGPGPGGCSLMVGVERSQAVMLTVVSGWPGHVTSPCWWWGAGGTMVVVAAELVQVTSSTGISR